MSDPPPALGPGAVSWKLHREVALLAGWGRAILLQLAHPLVAQGVADHSAFLSEPDGHVRRLRRTLASMLALTFGSDDEARDAAARINAIHDRVHGHLPGARGTHAAGARYSAHDPDLLAWVHATLLDSFLLTFRLFVADLTEAECDRYCAESSRIELLLGIPAGRLPRSRAGLERYLDAALASGEIAVTDTARRLAHAVLRPAVAWPVRPLATLSRVAHRRPPAEPPARGLPPPLDSRPRARAAPRRGSVEARAASRAPHSSATGPSRAAPPVSARPTAPTPRPRRQRAAEASARRSRCGPASATTAYRRSRASGVAMATSPRRRSMTTPGRFRHG